MNYYKFNKKNMTSYSQEFIGALVIVLVSVLKIFGVELGSDLVTAIVTGLLAIYVAYRRFTKGDITPLGRRIIS